MSDLHQFATAPFPDEVVTQARVRHLDLPPATPGAAGGTPARFALITLDNGRDHTRPTTFGPQGLANLDKALDQVAAEAAAGEIVGVGITGKPFVFAVGADLKGIAAIRERDHALAISHAGHEVFRRLGSLPVPTFAYYNGAAMGGGVEVGLHCTYRTVSPAIRGFSLPECFLGLVPGWGGCTLLPNLVGADRAVTVIIENALNQNRQLTGTQVFRLGIADAIFDGADFLEQSLRWTASVLRGEITVDRPAVDRGEAWEAAVERGKAIADAKVHGAAPAPYRALDLIAAARSGDLRSGFDAEDTALADLMMSDELRSSLYAFNLVNKRAKRPAGAPDRSLARPVTKIGVIGAGLMASQLALLFARRLEVPVVLTDIDAERIEAGVSYVHGEFDKLLAAGRITGDEANRLRALVTGSLGKDAFADADFVIEAVFEDLAVKQQVFAEVEAVVEPTAVLATNTSSLSVTEMASQLKHPERVVGFHFFNPVAVLPLVEVVRAERTDDASLATAFAIAKTLKKTAVLVKDTPAFVVNRILTRFIGAVLGSIDEGTPIEVADRALAPLGLPMSPIALLDLVGPAIAHHVSGTLHGVFPERFAVSESLGRLVAAGKRTIYRYDTAASQHGGKPEVDPEVAPLFETTPAAGGPPPRALSEDQVRERALTALAEEVRLMLDEGVVAEAQDIDLCLIMGAGWPFHLGGITPYLDRTGAAERVSGRRFLSPGIATVPV